MLRLILFYQWQGNFDTAVHARMGRVWRVPADAQ